MSRKLFTSLLQRDTLHALTLTQPWASLMALGAKAVETRSWRIEYRGPLAIHAAKKLPKHLDALCSQEHFRDALSAERYLDRRLAPSQRFPLGQVVAVGLLEAVLPVEQVQLDERERAFGNYAIGRYAWVFTDLYRLRAPIPARGTLSLWEWDPPETFWQEILSTLGDSQEETKE